jgi:hypothetical protein
MPFHPKSHFCETSLLKRLSGEFHQIPAAGIRHDWQSRTDSPTIPVRSMKRSKLATNITSAHFYVADIAWNGGGQTGRFKS